MIFVSVHEAPLLNLSFNVIIIMTIIIVNQAWKTSPVHSLSDLLAWSLRKSLCSIIKIQMWHGMKQEARGSSVQFTVVTKVTQCVPCGHTPNDNQYIYMWPLTTERISGGMVDSASSTTHYVHACLYTCSHIIIFIWTHRNMRTQVQQPKWV